MIIENGQEIQTVEIKSGATLNSDYFKALKKWEQLSRHTSIKTLVYSGDTQLTTRGINVLPWSSEQLLNPDRVIRAMCRFPYREGQEVGELLQAMNRVN